MLRNGCFLATVWHPQRPIHSGTDHLNRKVAQSYAAKTKKRLSRTEKGFLAEYEGGGWINKWQINVTKRLRIWALNKSIKKVITVRESKWEAFNDFYKSIPPHSYKRSSYTEYRNLSLNWSHPELVISKLAILTHQAAIKYKSWVATEPRLIEPTWRSLPPWKRRTLSRRLDQPSVLRRYLLQYLNRILLLKYIYGKLNYFSLPVL